MSTVTLEGRAFTGAWIETSILVAGWRRNSSRAFTGAWIETTFTEVAIYNPVGRAFTGAWIETKGCSIPQYARAVAPSQARGLKLGMRP